MVRSNKQASAELLSERVTYTVPQFCARNQISRPTYTRLRSQGRGPAEMRPGLNIIRITAEAEREWQRRMQEGSQDFEQKAVERAVKAGDAAVKSDNHVSKKRRRATTMRTGNDENARGQGGRF